MNNKPVKVKQFNGEDLNLAFVATYMAEERFSELPTLSKEKTPEFLSCMISGLSEVNRYVALLERELSILEYYTEKRRSTVMLEEVNQKLEERKIRSSEDARSAILALDEKVSDLEMKAIELNYLKNDCKARAKAIEAVYFTAQKMLDVKTFQPYGSVNGYDNLEGIQPGQVIRGTRHSER